MNSTLSNGWYGHIYNGSPQILKKCCSLAYLYGTLSTEFDSHLTGFYMKPRLECKVVVNYKRCEFRTDCLLILMSPYCSKNSLILHSLRWMHGTWIALEFIIVNWFIFYLIIMLYLQLNIYKYTIKIQTSDRTRNCNCNSLP